MNPWWASSRRQIRHRPNLRNTARGRPQRRQREWARVGYFGGRDWRTIFDLFVMGFLLRRHRLASEGLEAARAPLARDRHAQRLEEGERLGAAPTGGRDRAV